MFGKLRMKYVGIILFCLIFFVSCSEPGDYLPTVMFQNTLYRVASNANETSSFSEEGLINWVAINSSTENQDLPTKKFSDK